MTGSALARNLAIIVVAATLVAGWVMLSRKRPELRPQPRGEPVVPVQVTPIAAVERSRPITLRGQARARHRAVVRAQIGGAIAAVAPRCERGSRVAAGDVLVEIDPTEHEIALERARSRRDAAAERLRGEQSQLDSARALLGVIERRFELQEKEDARIRAMDEQKLVPASERDASSRQLAALEAELVAQRGRVAAAEISTAGAQADLTGAEGEIAARELDLARTHVAAPFAGTIVERFAEVGELATVGAQLFELAEIDVVIVEAAAPFELLGEIEEGASTVVHVAGSDDSALAGTVARLGVTSDPSTRTVVIEIEVANSEPPALLPGAFAEVTFRGRPRAGLFEAPAAAVFTHEDGLALFVATRGEDGHDVAALHTVREVWREPGDGGVMIYLRGDLPAGARVVTTAIERLARSSPTRIEIVERSR